MTALETATHEASSSQVGDSADPSTSSETPPPEFESLDEGTSEPDIGLARFNADLLSLDGQLPLETRLFYLDCFFAEVRKIRESRLNHAAFPFAREKMAEELEVIENCKAYIESMRGNWHFDPEIEQYKSKVLEVIAGVYEMSLQLFDQTNPHWELVTTMHKRLGVEPFS